MEKPDEKIISINDKPFFEEFKSLINKSKIIEKLHSFEVTDIDYSNSVSSVYSSNIEGNPINLNSYMRIINSNTPNLKKEKSVLEIEDMKDAYKFAQKNKLTMNKFLESHKIMSKDLKMSNIEKGAWRVGEEEAIYGDMGIVYIAIETKYVDAVMRDFFDKVDDLLKQKLDVDEVLYYGVWIHYFFAKIHPFRDGNGRAARLIQKWFISENIGDISWKIPFESYFKKHQEEYYNYLDIGVNFYESDFNSKKVLEFFKMSLNVLK